MKNDDKPKRILLPEIRVMAPRIRKVQEETVRLYPKGIANKRSIDSLKRIGYSKIGTPIKRKGEKDQYGTDASDIIKKALKK